MSTLTKVFVLLLSLSAIVLSMLVVAAFAQQQNYRAAADDWQATALAAQAQARAVSSDKLLQHQRDLDQHLRDAELVEKLNGEKLALQTRISEVERNLTDSNNKVALRDAQITSLADTQKLTVGSLSRHEEYASKITKRNSELERRNIDLNDRVHELTANLEMASLQVRALQEQISSLDEGTATAGLRPATQIPGGPGIVEAGVPTVQADRMPQNVAPIRGVVRSVQGNLASVSVGTADGVVPGMEFIVYRRDAGKPVYLATIKISRVETNESAGTIEQSEGDIQPGDTARDVASFAMAR